MKVAWAWIQDKQRAIIDPEHITRGKDAGKIRGRLLIRGGPMEDRVYRRVVVETDKIIRGIECQTLLKI